MIYYLFKYTKKISSTTPFTDAMGQYNYDDTGQKIGVYGNRQLYSLTYDSEVNVNNISNYSFKDLGIYVKMNYLYFTSTKGDDSGYHEFNVYLLDDAVHSGMVNYVGKNHEVNGSDYLSGAYSGIRNYCNESTQLFGTYDGKPWDYYKCNDGWQSSKTDNGCGNANLVSLIPTFFLKKDFYENYE